MNSKACTTCEKPKATLECGICQSPLCKSCAQIIETDSFSFMTNAPEELCKGIYCHTCFNVHVAGPIEDYNRKLEQAADVQVYLKKQSKETRLLSRKELPIKVENVIDHDEALLRLAFQAVELGFTALIDVEVISEKVRSGSYQTMKWKAIGIPSHIDESRIPKDRTLRMNPSW